MRLYHHKTSGGAEYLCLKPVDGAEEGDMRYAIVRLDGEPQLDIDANVLAAAPELLAGLARSIMRAAIAKAGQSNEYGGAE